jgi:hypothetical protein
LVTQPSGSILPLEDWGAHDDGMDDDGDDGDGRVVPVQLIGRGEHFEDVPGEVHQITRRRYNNIRLPRECLQRTLSGKTIIKDRDQEEHDRYIWKSGRIHGRLSKQSRLPTVD